MTQGTPPVIAKKKLIEVALPLDAINAASKREKSIRHGHPSTLHLWWARRPLAAARAVIFAQMVDDPSANPDLFQTERAQEKERRRLFGIIEELVKWENTTNETVLEQAREEIWQSWRRACAENADHPRAKELFNRHVLPAFHDPFAGGGSLPLEAQRLGLEAHASDLNPVAVLINKAMIEIPPKFAGKPPVNPEARGEKRLMNQTWRGAQGLAEDVRYYGRWMRDKAEKRIGHLYPKVRVTAEMAKERPDLKPYVGRELTVIAWLWARTVKSPNPAFANVEVPLASTFILSKKKGKEAYVEPVIANGAYHFIVKAGTPPEGAERGTKLRGANFRCVMSGTPVNANHIKSEGMAGNLKERLMTIITAGDRERVYLSPSQQHESTARAAAPDWKHDVLISGSTQYVGTKLYGMERFSQLATDRQTVALATFAELVAEVRKEIEGDARAAGMAEDAQGLSSGGTGARAYADAISTYLAFATDRCADYWSSLAIWAGDFVAHTFGRQAYSMAWDFAECNPFSGSTGCWDGATKWIRRVIQDLPCTNSSAAVQGDASQQTMSLDTIVSTDPPYYDNVPYADLSDFFYVWLRQALRSVFPDLFATVTVPKSEELVAFAHRHENGRSGAEAFFLDGMTRAMKGIARGAHPAFPVTVYYAFKQNERHGDEGAASTAWDTFLEATARAGFTVSGTWPLRTERQGRLRESRSNALASSIVLVCRARPSNAPSATRREFQEALRSEFPKALGELQRSNIAPVDLAQASIGPGMAVFTRYRDVLNADGSAMSVRDALSLINATLDEVLAEQEGDFDDDSRWALTWFEQHGYVEGEYGVAEQLSKAKNTSVDGLVRAGIIESRRGAVRILKPAELDEGWDPATDSRLTVWEMTQHLIRTLNSGGEQAAGALAAKLGSQAEAARDLAYRLYVVSERKRRAADALQYNSLVQSWPEIVRLAGEERAGATQGALDLDGA